MLFTMNSDISSLETMPSVYDNSGGSNFSSAGTSFIAQFAPDTMANVFCTTCHELEKSMGNSSSEFCTCTDDPYDAVNVLKEVPELQLTVITYALCIVAGVGGNVVSLFTMATADRKNKTVTNVFLISLTIADLLLLFIAAPMELVHYFAREFDTEGSTCKVAEYSRVLSAVASILNLLAVTVERFIVIVFPMRSRSLCTMTNCRRCLVLVWGLSVILAAPVLLTKSVYKLHYGNNDTLVTVSYCNDYDDKLGFAFTIYQLVAIFALPGILMIFCYSIVIRELWRSNQNMALLTNNASSRQRPHIRIHYSSNNEKSPRTNGTVQNNAQKADDVRAARRQVIKMLLWVVFLFLVCWGPRFVMEMLLKMQFDWIFRPSVYWTRVGLFLLPFIHAVLNPVIYFVMSRNFRASVMRKFTECTCRNHDQEDPFGMGAVSGVVHSRHVLDATPLETGRRRLSNLKTCHNPLRNGSTTRNLIVTASIESKICEELEREVVLRFGNTLNTTPNIIPNIQVNHGADVNEESGHGIKVEYS